MNYGGMAAKLENWRREFTTALEEEIAWQQEHGGHRYILSEGLFLGRSGERFLYLFEMDADHALPDDTPVWLRAGGVGVAGEVLGVDGFHLTLALEDFLGTRVGRADMRAAFWQLLIALRERLAEVGVVPGYNVDMALAAVVPPLLSSCGAEKTRGPCGLGIGRDAARRMAETRPLTVVWGPPGTGKTEVLADIAAGHYRAGRTVLIVSHSNVAVDNAVARVARFLTGDPGLIAGRVVRYGPPRLPEVRHNEFVATAYLAARVRPDLMRLMVGLEEQRRILKQRLGAGSVGGSVRTADGEPLELPGEGDPRRALAEVEQRLYRVRQEIRALEDEIAAGAAVLATTLARATVKAAVYGRPWDTVILDEASMASLPQVFFAAALARRHLVLLGDFRQLAPIAQADTPVVREWLRRDVFDQLGVIRAVDEGLPHPHVVLLAEQRRMHPAIAAFSSAAVYNGLLTSAPGMARRRAEIVDRRPFPGRALAGIDLTGSPAATGKRIIYRPPEQEAAEKCQIGAGKYRTGVSFLA